MADHRNGLSVKCSVNQVTLSILCHFLSINNLPGLATVGSHSRPGPVWVSKLGQNQIGRQVKAVGPFCLLSVYQSSYLLSDQVMS